MEIIFCPIFAVTYYNTASQWTLVNGNGGVEYDGNSYVYNLSDPGYGLAYAGSLDWTDYIVEADYKVISEISDQNSGIGVRFNGTTSYDGKDTSKGCCVYAYWLTPAPGYEKLGILAFPYVWLQDNIAVTLRQNTWYHLKVSVNGYNPVNIKTYLDGVLKIDYLDSTYKFSSGRVALMVSGHQTHFDNIRVHKFASPEPSLGLGAEQPISTPSQTPTSSPTPTVTAPTLTPTATPTTTQTPTSTATSIPTPTPTVSPIVTPANTPAPKQPLLTVSQTTLKEEPEVGEEVLITVSLQNTGEATARNIRLTEQIPSSIVVSYIDGANKPGNLITWEGELAPNRTHAITHTMKIVEKKDRSFPVIIKYEDEAGNQKETSSTVYVSAYEPPIPAPTPVWTPNPVPTSEVFRLPGFTAPMVLIGFVVVVLMVRRR